MNVIKLIGVIVFVSLFSYSMGCLEVKKSGWGIFGLMISIVTWLVVIKICK